MSHSEDCRGFVYAPCTCQGDGLHERGTSDTPVAPAPSPTFHEVSQLAYEWVLAGMDLALKSGSEKVSEYTRAGERFHRALYGLQR